MIGVRGSEGLKVEGRSDLMGRHAGKDQRWMDGGIGGGGRKRGSYRSKVEGGR